MAFFGSPAERGIDANGREELPESQFLRAISDPAAGSGWLVVGWALLFLAFWLFRDAPPAVPGVPGVPRLVPLTAFCFLALGAALIAAARWTGAGEASSAGRPGRSIFLAAAAAVLALPSLRLLQDLVGFSLSLDVFPLALLVDRGGLGGARMSPATAANFLLLGGALLLAAGRRSAAYQLLVAASMATCFLSLYRFLYGGKPLIAFSQMSLAATLLFQLAALGILFLRRDVGAARLLIADTEGGRLMRRLLLPAVLIPPAFGWLRLQGERAGLFETESGLALFALSNVVLFSSLVLIAAFRLERADQRRDQAELKTRGQLERMQLLHRITRATAARENPAGIFQTVADSLEKDLPADFVCACLVETGVRQLEVAAVGAGSRLLAGAMAMPERSRLPVDPAGLETGLAGQLVYETDTAEIPLPFAQRLALGGLRSVVLAPLQAEKQVFGLLVVARRAAGGFTSSECEFLRQLSESVALASSQAELNEALRTAYYDLRETQQAVLHQDRLRVLGELSSGIAHDINNSIAPAALHLEKLVEQEQDLTDGGRRRLETAQRAIADVVQTIKRMQLLYRRQDNQPLKLVDLNALVLQVLDLTRVKWRDTPQERGHVIEILNSLAPDLPPIRGVESEIREALTNLVLNAADAMPEGGLLSFRTSLRKLPGGLPRVIVEVSDSGIGMDEATRRRCLEPFFTTKGERGSGLGLTMVRGVTERHDADIELDSAPGRGTTFRLSFPIPAMEPGRSAVEPVVVPENDLRILVVDDDPILRETIAEILVGDGHRVVIAEGGPAALAILHESHQTGTPFDLVLTDLGMPEVDGRRVAAAAKERSKTRVILLTGWGHRMLAERETPAYVDLVMSKPPRLQELRVAISQVIRGSAA